MVYWYCLIIPVSENKFKQVPLIIKRGEIKMETKYYVLSSIDGDYAWLTCTSAQEEPYFIARALLPMEADEGSKLKFENFQFTII